MPIRNVQCQISSKISSENYTDPACRHLQSSRCCDRPVHTPLGWNKGGQSHLFYLIFQEREILRLSKRK
jgi:hypothetical protein